MPQVKKERTNLAEKYIRKNTYRLIKKTKILGIKHDLKQSVIIEKKISSSLKTVDWKGFEV